jgi:NADPH2:quinone reductase
MNWSVARLRNLSVSQELMLTPTLMELPEAQAAQANILKQCAGLFDSDELKVVVAKTFRLDEAAQAQRHLENEHPAGKVVLSID